MFNPKTKSSAITHIELGMFIDGGGGTLVTGDEGQFRVPFDCDIVGWTILGQPSAGSISIDILRSTYSNFPTMTSIIGTGTKPFITSDQKNQSFLITDWSSVRLCLGDIIKFNIASVSTFTQATVNLTVKKVGVQ